MIRTTTRLEIDEDELRAVIDWHRAMPSDAPRKRRIAELELALRRKVDWRT